MFEKGSKKQTKNDNTTPLLFFNQQLGCLQLQFCKRVSELRTTPAYLELVHAGTSAGHTHTHTHVDLIPVKIDPANPAPFHTVPHLSKQHIHRGIDSYQFRQQGSWGLAMKPPVSPDECNRNQKEVCQQSPKPTMTHISLCSLCLTLIGLWNNFQDPKRLVKVPLDAHATVLMLTRPNISSTLLDAQAFLRR